MTRRKASYNVWLEPRQIERLRELSSSTRVPASQILRDVLDEGLERWAARRLVANIPEPEPWRSP